MSAQQYSEDPRLAEAKALPLRDVIDRLGIVGLRRQGGEMIGPCPVCAGRDRFGANLRSGVFNCRRCERGGDGIALVQLVLSVDFPAALSWLCGERDLALDPAVQARRMAAARAKQEQQDADSARHRARAIAAAQEIWQQSGPATGTPVQDYLAKRGITGGALDGVPSRIRFHPNLPYMARGDRGWQEIHRGPAMVAAVQAPDDRLTAVHRTWIDLDQDNGKLALTWKGEALVAKKVQGSKKGGAIRITTAPAPCLVVGEGIETTMTALAAGIIPDAAFWCGVDLGNMAGRRKLGPGLRYAGEPDLADTSAWLPPPWVEKLIFIQDGDSAPKLTKAKLLSGLRRAQHHRRGLVAKIWSAGTGVDLNDLVEETP